MNTSKEQLLNIYGLLVSSEAEFNIGMGLIKIYCPEWLEIMHLSIYNNGGTYLNCHDASYRLHISHLGIAFSGSGLYKKLNLVKDNERFTKEEFLNFMDKVYLNETRTITGENK